MKEEEWSKDENAASVSTGLTHFYNSQSHDGYSSERSEGRGLTRRATRPPVLT